MSKAGARDTDRATGLDLSTVYSESKSILGLFISFPKNKNKNAPDVYETCLGKVNPDTNKDLVGHNGFKKQLPVKHGSPLPPFQQSTLGFKGLMLPPSNFTAITVLTFCFSPFPQFFNGKLFQHPSFPKHTRFYILAVQPLLQDIDTTAGWFSNVQFVVPIILEHYDNDFVSCAPYHDYEDVPGLLAPCAEVALAMLCGSAWELSGRVESIKFCHGINTVLGSHYDLDPQATQLPQGTCFSHLSLPFSPIHLPIRPPSFLQHHQQYPGRGPIKPPAQMALLLSLSASVANTLPRRTFPCGSLHLPKRRCLVPFGTPWGAQDICTEMADMTQDYRKPAPICTSGKKPGRTQESY